MNRLLITGGAGFVGSNLAIAFKEDYEHLEVIALDNLSRRGSELNLIRLQEKGIRFVHGDVRNREDLTEIGPVDWLIECSAEPSVHAGFNQSPAYLINTNLVGLIHCLEYLREFGGNLVFLSTSRVYPIQPLCDLPLLREENRFALSLEKPQQGITDKGIAERFPLEGARSLYGATKLCGELLIQEYQQMYGLKAIINRCGVLTGPWQMGKVDQGFIALWLARHLFGGQLRYMGFGGEGLQVRDILHVKDLYALMLLQMQNGKHQGELYNVGGGIENSVSLKELTQKVQSLIGEKREIEADPLTRPADIPFYVTDISKVTQHINWRPRFSVEIILEEMHRWLVENRSLLRRLFAI